MRFHLIIWCSFCGLLLSAQSFTYPVLPKSKHYIKEIIPQNWMILDSAAGDINRDGTKDKVLILQYRDSVTIIKRGDKVSDTVITKPRMLCVLLQKNQFYHLVKQHNSFIHNHDTPITDDPYNGISIKKGVISISFRWFQNTGSWYVSNDDFKFRYQNNGLYLIGADTWSLHRGMGDITEVSYNFITKKKCTTTGKTISGENQKVKSAWEKLSAKPLIEMDFIKEAFVELL